MYQHRMKASHSVIFSAKTVFMIKKKSRIRSFRSSHTTQKVSIFVVFLVRIQLNAGTYIPKNCEYRLLLCSVVTQFLMNCNPSLQKQPSIGTLQKAVLKTFVRTTENLLVQVRIQHWSFPVNFLLQFFGITFEQHDWRLLLIHRTGYPLLI